MKIPFILNPKGWFMKSEAKEIAKAQHELSGEALERKILEIKYADNEAELKLKLLDVDLKYGKLTKDEFNKELATIKGEPYVVVVKTNFDPKNPKKGFFELDWNEHFIENLKSNGYTAPDDDQVVSQWFDELCRNIALETTDPDVLAELQEQMKAGEDTGPVDKKEVGDGKVEYS